MEYKGLVSAVPHQSLGLITGKLKLTEADIAMLHQHQDVFINRKAEFAEFFYNSFFEITDTRILLERYKPERMKQTWANWFERLFREDLDANFIGYLWRIGLRHVEVNLDQRFSNLGFSLVRQFCQGVMRESFDAGTTAELLPIVNKIMDFCILVETSAYIDATVRCDIEILRGIADKIRNPVTIIGGNLRRMHRHMSPADPLYKDYDFLISYTARCEDMIEDIHTYMDIFQREAKPEKCMLETIMDDVLEKLRARNKLEGVRLEILLSPEARFVRGDPVDLRDLFFHVIENALDASLAAQGPYVRISSAPQENPPHTVRVDVFNNGEVINLANIANILTPFYSTRSKGSGLGLSIVKMALRKNYGDIDFEPVLNEGTMVHITLHGNEH